MGDLTVYDKNGNPIHPGKPRMGLFGLLTGSIDTWCLEKETAIEVRRLDAQTKLIEARQKVVRAEYVARIEALQLEQQYEQEVRELVFWRTLNTVPEDMQLTYLERQKATELLLAERETLLRNRREGISTPPVPALPPPDAPVPVTETAIQPYVSDREIQRIASRALMKLGSLTGVQAEIAWKAFHQELMRRYPQNIVQEIEDRVEELHDEMS